MPNFSYACFEFMLKFIKDVCQTDVGLCLVGVSQHMSLKANGAIISYTYAACSQVFLDRLLRVDLITL